jgi:hypothetical protein
LPIEVDQSGKRGEPAQETRELGDLPYDLDVVHPVVDDQDGDIPSPTT